MSKLICTFWAFLLLSGCTSSPKNIDEMVQRAELGDPSIQISLAAMYSKGIGTARDYSKALYWYEQAANQGDAKAQNERGK